MADKPEEKPQIMPWQEGYELKPNQPVVPVEVPKEEKAAATGKMPWEMKWEAKPKFLPRKEPEPVNAGGMEDYINKTIMIESGGNPAAKNPNSSATGLGQFIDSTWKDAVREAGKNYTLEDRNDPTKSKEIFVSFTNKNRQRAIQDLKREPSHVELYMYHFLGREGAGDFLQAPKDKPATDFVTSKVAKANSTIFYSGGQPRTVGEVINNFKRKY